MATNKERTEAANALVNWFNSQEVAPADALAIMSKVMAKIIVGTISGAHAAEQRKSLDHAIDRTNLQLIHDINDRIFATRR